MLQLLQEDSTQTTKQLSAKLSLSVTAIYERIKKLDVSLRKPLSREEELAKLKAQQNDERLRERWGWTNERGVTSLDRELPNGGSLYDVLGDEY